MADETDLSAEIASNASKPASMSADGISATSKSLPDQIAADQYLASKRAARRPPWGMRIGKIISPGGAE